MSKKNFKTAVKGADKLFSANDTQGSERRQDTQDTSYVQDTQDTSYVQDTQDAQKKHGSYRLNLKLDIKLKNYIHDAAWRQRTNVTQYIVGLIKADQTKHNEGDNS